MIIGMAVIGFIDNFIVVIADSISLWQFHATRSAIDLTILGVLAWRGWAVIRPQRWRPVLARSALFSGSMLIYFGCLAFLPIAVVVAGLFTSPVLVMIISGLFLGKRVGAVRWGSAALGFTGILFVINPVADEFDLLSLLPLVAALLYATSAVATRQWCEGETTATLLFWFFVIIGVASLIVLGALTVLSPDAPSGPTGFIARGLGWPSAAAWFWIGAQAVGSVIAVGLITRAYQIGEASFVAIFEYSLMIFAPLWAYFIWRSELSVTMALGITLIAASGAIIAWRSRI